MIDEAQVKNIVRKALDEEHLTGFIKIFEKEHNLFRGSHDKIGLPENLKIPEKIITQIIQEGLPTGQLTGDFIQYDAGIEVWKRIPALNQGSILFADANGYFTEDKANLVWNDTRKVLEILSPTGNTFIGKGVIGAGNSVGDKNVFLGYEVGYANVAGHQNTFVGYLAGRLNEESDEGALFGYYAGYYITNSSQNACFGAHAGKQISTGQGRNACFGYNSGSHINTGYFNVMIGAETGGVITTGYKNTCLGYNAEVQDTGSHHRIAIGYYAVSKENNLCVIGGTAAADAVSLAIFRNKEFRFYDDGNNYVGFKAPALVANKIWVLPVADGNAGEVIITDGYGNLSWAAASGATTFTVLTDTPVNYSGAEGKFVKVNATPDALVFADIAWADVSKIGSNLTDLATRQHAGLTDVSANQHHAQTHTLASHSTKPHSALTDVGANQHHNQLHGASHHSGGGDAIKLDDLASPDDNVDLNASTIKHGLLMKLGGGIINFLRADGTWATPAGGGNGATTFLGLTDTPANYTGAGNKIVKVNATPDALVFGADISDLENVDSISGQAGKYARVKAADAGIEWVVGAGNGGGYGKEVIDEIFDSLIDGDIHGQGVYSGWAAWNTDVEDADCSAQIVANPGNGKMLRLTDNNAAGIVNARLDADAGREIVQCLFRCKMRISSLVDTNKRGYIGIWDKDARHTGIYFRDNFLKWYTGGAAVDIVAAVANTWYDVIVFMDCTAAKALIWVDGVLKLTAQSCQTQDIESFTFYTSSLGTGYTVDFDDLLIVDLTRKP